MGRRRGNAKGSERAVGKGSGDCPPSRCSHGKDPEISLLVKVMTGCPWSCER